MIRTRVVWTGVAGTPYYTNFFWNGSGPSIAEDAQDSTIAWVAEIVGLINPLFTLTCDSEVTEINPESGEIVTAYDVPGSASVGTNVGEPYPFRTQVLTYFGTTNYVGGRRVRGRSFLGGLNEVIGSSGSGPFESTREVIQGVYEEHLGGSLAQHVVWSRPRPATEDAPARAGAVSTVPSYQTRPTWSSLRSRGA